MKQERSVSKGPEKRRHPDALNGLQRWQQLSALRQGMMTRFEQYASVTIPKVCLPDGVNQNSSSIQHDWSSVGAQAVNHLTSKLAMALFQPGLPFFRLDPDKNLKQQIAENGIPEDAIRSVLVSGEQDALRVMDQLAVRPKLHEAIRSLIVVGNSLLDLSDKDSPRVVGIRHYVVKRSISGKPQEILHRERVLYNELEDKVQAKVPMHGHGEQAYVEYIRWFQRVGKQWKLSVSVNGIDLGEEFGHAWNLDRFPIYPLTWDLADEHDYGTGLVEDYAGDFGTLSTLSESEIKAAILISDFRWLANPAGIGDIEEFKRSQTGDVIPGVSNDLSLIAHVNSNALQQLSFSIERVINRIGRAFLLGSAITRDAERVTAEEIRMQANELETSLGGVYSRLAVDMQLPLAVWLMAQIDVTIQGSQFVPSIVTGLAALSRNAEAQQLTLFMSSLANMGVLPPMILDRIKLTAVISTMASAYGINPSEYVYSEEEVAAAQEAQQAQQQEMNAQDEVVKASAQSIAKGPQQ